jgi:hypothetical protein
MISKLSNLISGNTASVIPEPDPNLVLDRPIEEVEKLKPGISPRAEKSTKSSTG